MPDHRTRTRCGGWPLVALISIAASLIVTPRAMTMDRGDRRAAKAVRITGTLEAAIGQPMVEVQLRDGKRTLRAKAGALGALLGDDQPVSTFRAFLDTGASGFVISKVTAERFGVVAAENAEHEEVGLHGKIVMGVSERYDVVLMGGAGSDDLFGGRKTRLLLNRAGPPAGLMSFMPALDVIGMPAIERLVVEIDPGTSAERFRDLVKGGADGLLNLVDAADGSGFGPKVRLHPRGKRVRGGDVTVTLEYRDFNPARGQGRRGPRGPRPALAENPLVPRVTVEHGGRSTTGDWLLDTGAAASIISTAHARAIGLLDANGKPARAPDFTLSLGGVGGTLETVPGFIVERLRVPAGRDVVLEFIEPRVVVRDIGVELTPGNTVMLDGVFGMNLLLPSARGLGGIGGLGAGGAAGPIEVSDPPFKRVWIDGPRRRLVLER